VNRFAAPRSRRPAQELVDRAIAEIDGAIALVITGAARTVQLYGLPGAEYAAAIGAARAQEAGVAFRIEHDRRAGVTVVVGPKRSG
jgi:hypothetical protein